MSGEADPCATRLVASPSVYIIGSLRNPAIPKLAEHLRDHGFDAFDDWYAAGPEADDIWRDYEKARGNAYVGALGGWHAEHVFAFDKRHLDRCDMAVLVQPAGRSGHLELGYFIGLGKPGFILMDDHARWDIMNRFATGVAESAEELVEMLQGYAEVPF